MSALSDRIARNTATINAQSALIQSQAAIIKAKDEQLVAAKADQADSAAAVAKLDEDNAAAQAVLDANKPA